MTFAWLQGGHVLRQDVDVVPAGDHVTGIEIIGRERPAGEAVEGQITFRFYGNSGEPLDYVDELDGDTLTIWVGRGLSGPLPGAVSALTGALWAERGSGPAVATVPTMSRLTRAAGRSDVASWPRAVVRRGASGR